MAAIAKKRAEREVDASLLTPVELFALRQVGKQADKLRDRLPLGEHAVDCVLHVYGVLHVSPDGPAHEGTESPQAGHLLGLVLAEIGERKLREIVPAIAEQLREYRVGGELRELPTSARLLAEDLHRACERRCVTSRRGNVTGALQASVKHRANSRRKNGMATRFPRMRKRL